MCENQSNLVIFVRFSDAATQRVGDTTWPGLSTVVCVLGSRLVAEDVLVYAVLAFRAHVPCPGPARRRLCRTFGGGQRKDS
jgi:hypothetical protein